MIAIYIYAMLHNWQINPAIPIAYIGYIWIGIIVIIINIIHLDASPYLKSAYILLALSMGAVFLPIYWLIYIAGKRSKAAASASVELRP